MQGKLTRIASLSALSRSADESPGVSHLAPRARGAPTVDFKRAARLLYEASDADPLLKHALESSHVAIDTFGRILGLSADTARMLGFAQSRLVGRRLVHRISGGDRVAFHRAMARVRSTLQPFELALSVRSKDGTLRPVILSLSAISGTKNAVVVLRLSVGDRCQAGIDTK